MRIAAQHRRARDRDGERFYGEAFGLHRRPPLRRRTRSNCSARKSRSTCCTRRPAAIGGRRRRCATTCAIGRRCTVDVVVEDLDDALIRAIAAGAIQEGAVREAGWGRDRATRRSVRPRLVPAAVPRPRLRRDRHAMTRKRSAHIGAPLPLRSRCRRTQPPLGMPPANLPARLLAEAPAADPQCLPRLRLADRAGRPRGPGLRRSRAVAPGRARPQRRRMDGAARAVRGSPVPAARRPRLDPAGAGRRQVGRRCRGAAAGVRLPAALAHRRRDGRRSPRPAVRSARTSTSTTCSCCRRRAIGAGRSMRRRRWAQRAALDFRDDVELKLLRDFNPTHDWVLGPATCSTCRPACRTTASRWIPA